jgi:hypothetical protein
MNFKKYFIKEAGPIDWLKDKAGISEKAIKKNLSKYIPDVVSKYTPHLMAGATLASSIPTLISHMSLSKKIEGLYNKQQPKIPNVSIADRFKGYMK